MNLDPDQAAAEPKALHGAIFRKGILVVDDSDLQRLVSSEILRSMGVELIYEATNGVEALELLRDKKLEPAVMLVDLHMPTMDGIELIQELAKFNSQIAIVILSGADSALLDTLGSMVRACKMTMLGALPKPLNGNILFDKLTRYRPSVSSPIPQHVNLSAVDVKRALRLSQIKPFYQPKISGMGLGWRQEILSNFYGVVFSLLHFSFREIA
ncbi:MAG: response regulator, partial [Moraxellaceae bacterium]